jgi:hypothetical protein
VRWELVLPSNFLIANRMDQRDKSIMSFMMILPPTKHDLGIQYWETYVYVGHGVADAQTKE